MVVILIQTLEDGSLKHLQELEIENALHQRAVCDLTPDIVILAQAANRNC